MNEQAPAGVSEIAVDLAAIRAAHARIAPHINRTPVLSSPALDEAIGAHLFFKCENLQKVAAFKARGTRILLVGPALSLVGAEGLVPLSTALEGQRALAKSAARQWGSHGIVINWLAVASTVFAPELAEAKLPRPVSPEPLALGDAPTLAGIVPLIFAMADRAGAVLAGATQCLDGGEVMTP